MPCSELYSWLRTWLCFLEYKSTHVKQRMCEICCATFWVMLHFDNVQAVWLGSGIFILLLKLCLEVLGDRILHPSRGYTWICWLNFQEREAEQSWAVKDCFSLRDVEGDWPAILSIVRYVHDFFLRKHSDSVSVGLGKLDWWSMHKRQITPYSNPTVFVGFYWHTVLREGRTVLT